MMENGNEHVVVDDEEGRGEDDALVEEDNLSDEDMPFDDDDNMSDEDDNDEGSEDDNGDDLMLQLERNDPDLLNFVILNTDRPLDGWAALGESIGRNTMLNELDFDYEPLSEIGVNLYRGLVKNRSIKKLKLCSNRACGEIFLYLIPFFTKNKSLESLEIIYLNSGRFHSLEYALDQFNGLKEFSLICNVSIEGEDKVIQSLSGHTGLRKLSLAGVQIGMEGFTILAAMLLSPSCCLSTLSLHDQYNLDDELANILSSGLNGNGTLTELDLSGSLGCTRLTRLTAIGWQAIFGPLKSSTCMISTLNLGSNHISDTALPSIMSALSNNVTIKDLKLSIMENSDAFLQAMIQFLQSPSCILESINLSNNSRDSRNSFDDEKIESLTNALANNCRIKKLNLLSNRSVTPAGWQTLFQLVQRPSCGLESLDIRSNNLTDETVVSLASAITNGSRLRELDLSFNTNVSSATWQVLVHALRIHAPALEMLGMSAVDNGLIDSCDVLLTDNHKLKKLRILDTDIDRQVRNVYMEVFTRILDDTSNILSTYNSNHVVEELCSEDECYMLPTQLRSLLRINKENSPSQAALIKIIKAHFSGSSINTQVFNHMELNVHPIAIAWMGGSKTNDLLFAFLRSMPSVCDTTRKVKKRKAVDEV
jgi:hypothetical protein